MTKRNLKRIVKAGGVVLRILNVIATIAASSNTTHRQPAARRTRVSPLARAAWP
jgi:hypothetical protein